MSNKNTHILAVTSDSVKVAAIGMQEGFLEFKKGIESFPFETNDTWIGPRDVLERDDNFKQIIPYVIVERDGKILVYQRTDKGGETRLHGFASVGFGGHIDIGDISMKANKQTINLEMTVANAVQRELIEELKLNDGYESFEAYGLLLDESNEVGRVHVGIVMIARVKGMVLSNEDQIELLGFKDFSELAEMLDSGSLESWSSIVIKAILKSGEIPS